MSLLGEYEVALEAYQSVISSNALYAWSPENYEQQLDALNQFTPTPTPIPVIQDEYDNLVRHMLISELCFCRSFKVTEYQLKPLMKHGPRSFLMEHKDIILLKWLRSFGKNISYLKTWAMLVCQPSIMQKNIRMLFLPILEIPSKTRCTAYKATITLPGICVRLNDIWLGRSLLRDILDRSDKTCLTQRAPDWWESARFQALCVA